MHEETNKTHHCKKYSEPPINSENIWEGDCFDRKGVAEDFTNIIKSINQPFVISINAPYGSGKSFFIKRWQKQLEVESNTLYFNAWENDFIEKPLIPFVQQLLDSLEVGKNEEHIKNIKENAKNAICAITKIATNGLVDLKDFAKQDTTPDSIKDYKEMKDAIEAFKTSIKEYMSETASNMYIFIDELERCRPTFAIELLEHIKHLFNIDGVVFILSIDRSQLKHTIKNIYGQEMDGEGYLRRFIDLELTLPKPTQTQLQKFIEELRTSLNIPTNNDTNILEGFSEFHHHIELLNHSFNLSLRDIEHIYTEANIIATMLQGFKSYPPILALLMCLKYKKKEIYNIAESYFLDIKNIAEFINDYKLTYKANHYDPIIGETLISMLIANSYVNLTIDMAALEEKMKDDALAINVGELNRENIIDRVKGIYNAIIKSRQYGNNNHNWIEFIKSKIKYLG